MDAEVDTGNATAGPPALRRRRFAVALVLLLAAAVVATVVLGTRSRSPRAADTGVSVGGAAIVQRRDLVETDTESGTLSYADPQTVYNRLNGTITWLPAVGELIRPGQTLYTVNGRAVVLLDGALPAYRVLKAKDTAGQDVLQLNSDLVQMGFADGQITIDDTWQTGTTDAVERWQASLGEKQTGEITLGRIVFLPGAQRVTQLDTTCGSTGGGAGGGSNSVGGSGPTNGCGISEARTTVPAPHPEFVDLTTSSTTTSTTTTTTTTTPTTTTTTTTTTTPKHTKSRSGHKGGGSRKRSKRSGSGSGFSERSGNGAGGGKGSSGSGGGNGTGAGKSASGSGKSASGSGKSASGSGKGSGKDSGNGGSEGSASAILQTTSTRLVATVDLAASAQSEAVVGARVTVEMPDGSTVGGTIAAVSPVAENPGNNGTTGGGSSSGGANGGSGPGSGSGSSATVPVTITLDEHVKGVGLDQAPVSVNFAQAKAKHVLSVPVTALVATSGDTYAVQEAAPPHELLPVSTGLFAAGYVQISGPGIYPGLNVTDSQG